HHRPSRPGGEPRPDAGGEVKGSDPAPALPGGDPGRDRWKDNRARERFGVAKKRNREMLRRRYHPETQTPRETKRRQKAHEKHRQEQHPPGSLHPGAQSAITDRSCSPGNTSSTAIS